MRVLTLILLTIATLSCDILHANNLYPKDGVSRAVPEAFTGIKYQKSETKKHAMISAANPHAVSAGMEMFKLGGNAIDAAVAVQLVLTLVEPQSSGIGGGAFLLWFDGQTKKIATYDGRETAPAAATPELFFENGKPVRWIDAVIGGRSVGVPGVLHMLHKVHQEKGALAWHKLFEPAIKLAENGFIVSARLSKLVAMKMNPGLSKLSPAKEYFYPNGKPIQEGQLLINKPYANALKMIAKQGIDVFYKGIIAKHIVEAVTHSKLAPGKLALSDMEGYRSKQRDAVCADYQAPSKNYEICSMGPPSSGGVTTLQILSLLNEFDFGEHEYLSERSLHLYSQAARLAFADRDKYLADSDFVDVPVTEMLAPHYLAKRAKLINPARDMGRAKPGVPDKQRLALNESIAQPNTSHISIIDNQGNAISMTTSIEMGFGSTVMVDGFLLNNQLTDFSLMPTKHGQNVSNRVEPLKRPRSSMSPVIVTHNDDVYAVIGSPGGSRIINYVGFALFGMLEFDIDLETLVNGPRFSNRNGYTSIERNSSLVKFKRRLEKKGHLVKEAEMTSGIHAIIKTKSGWTGVADPRREGTVDGY